MSQDKLIKTNQKGNVSVASYLTSQIDLVVGSGEKTQKQIAAELGYTKPNIITMFKQGLTNLPINKVELMAKAIHADPVYLLRLTMQEYMPEAFETITKILGDTALYSDMEKSIIKEMREHATKGEIRIETPAQVTAYQHFIDTL
jgi:predicted XRE-type DNA-binding protein